MREKAITFAQEFKQFAMKGNVVDLAVGVIIGGAFGKIVSSLVSDVIMPPIGLLLGGVNFKDISIVLKEAVDKHPAVTLNIGMFVQTIFDFLIVALSVFFMIRMLARLKRREKEAPTIEPEPSKEELLLTEIRDLLKNK